MADCERRRGIHHPRTRAGWERRRDHEVEACNLVPVAPFRERFLDLRSRNLITASQLCWHMGWTYQAQGKLRPDREWRRRGLKPDTTRALRTLGLHQRGCQEFVTYEAAERLCRALGMDPFEAGI